MSVQNSHQISDIKVLLKIGANGNGIVSVEKTGTVGNVDTYTITFSDGTTTNFDLTNGTSIDTIEKTDTQGFVDTYTITLTDGSTTTFEVTNGRDTSGDISAIVDLYGAKNLNAYPPYRDTSQVSGGITWTDNGDGTVSADGTATADSRLRCHTGNNPIYLPNGTYKVNGCPAGGSDTTWGIRWYGLIDDSQSSSEELFDEYGEEQEIVVNRTAGDGFVECSCYVFSGATIPAGGITFKPMIRDSRIEDDSFVPYAMTNKQMTEQKADVNKTIATKEGAVASKAYNIGDWIVDSEGYSGVVIASVSQGSAWTLNTNYARRDQSTAHSLLRLSAVSDTTKTYNEVLNSFWNLISAVPSSKKMNLAIGESGSGGRRYISRVVLCSNSEAYFNRCILSMNNQGRIDIAQFYCHATNSKAGTNVGGTYTDLSSDTISSTIELILFI